MAASARQWRRRRLGQLPAALLTMVTVLAMVPAAAAVACTRQAWYVAVVELCMCVPCASCHYEISTLSCVASAPSSAEVSTTTATTTAVDDTTFAQPLLAPDAWFLSAAELTASRGGVERADLRAWSDDNEVDTFAATDAFFAAVDRDVEAATAPAQVLLTGWEMDDVPFLPTARDWQESRFRALFGRAIARGANVSALVWTNVFRRARNIALQQWLNALAPRGTWLFDNRVPYRTSSHHQKTVTIAHGAALERSSAFVGGTDLTGDRWDSRFHNMSALRRDRGLARAYDGWIDASARLRGPAVRDVSANFIARWNEPRAALQEGEEQLLGVFANDVNATSIRPLLDRDMQGNGTASVQITRTYSCKEGYAFAPHGEVSILQARLKAIALATNYIYVEDQYFIHVPQLQAALLKQLPKIRALVVVTQPPSLATSVAGYEVLLYRMLRPLLDAFPDKVHAFAPRAALDLYVHSKALVVDDVFLSIGSANWNRRSMTSDSEVAASIVDRAVVEHTPDGVAVAGAARHFRLVKFSEFSGRAVDELARMSFLDGVRALRDGVDDSSDGNSSNSSGRKGILAPLDVQDALYFNVYPSGFEDQVDPDDVC